MNKFFVRQKLSIDDITHLSDVDSEYAINTLRINIGDVVEIETYEAIYLGIITDIQKKSVEVEIREEVKKKGIKDSVDITVAQSLISRNKFHFFLQKATEIGIDRVVPVESQYSTIKRHKAVKEYASWKKIIEDATEQSRTTNPLIIEKPVKLEDLNTNNISNRVCLCTENTEYISLQKYLKTINLKEPFLIAIGPEKGWSSKDINLFKSLDFTFVKLQGNILRTESVGLVVGSIIKYVKGEI